jgi:hypothetical protein
MLGSIGKMNATEFVDAIRTEVRDSTINGVIDLIKRPPGRNPSANLVAISQWFNALSNDDKRYIREVVIMACHHTILGLLAVLDGVRVIENGADRGMLELWYVKGKESTLLNASSGIMLHDLFQMLSSERE